MVESNQNLTDQQNDLINQAVAFAREAKVAAGGLDRDSKQQYANVMEQVRTHKLESKVVDRIADEARTNLDEWKDRTNNRGTLER